MQISFKELQYRLFYTIFTYFLTFLLFVDSWEYILIRELSFSETSLISSTYIFSQLQSGQGLIYVLSFYYTLLVSTFFILIQFLIYFLPSLYNKEIYYLSLKFNYYFNFILSYFLNTNLFFPIIYRDLLQYSYNNLNDRIFNFNIEYLLDLSKMLFFKIEIELFIGFFLSFLYFIYNTISKNKILFLKYIIFKKLILFCFFLSFFIFFENNFYIIFILLPLIFLLIEILTFILISLQRFSYKD